MMVMARGMEYGELRDSLAGKKVFLWSCTTCARLCGISGAEESRRLADSLESDGIEVVGCGSTSASCLVPKVEGKLPSSSGCDAVVVLACSIGSACASMCTDAAVVNPVRTFGQGYMDASGEPVAVLPEGDVPLSELASREGLTAGAFK